MEDDKAAFELNPSREGKGDDSMGSRLLYVVIIWLMLSVASTVLTALTLLQFAIMVLNKGEANERIADVGTDLGIWIAKAARYQTGASDVKPWPWTDFD
ncbi:MAG: DUF4389 domain-containing protein [Pseudomonadota bacterium]